MRLTVFICLLMMLSTSMLAYGFNEKLLLGKIEGQRYTALKNRFSVNVPYELNNRSRDDILIKETTNAAISNVTFSHKLPNRPVYRMEIASVTPSSARENPFEDAAYETLGWYKNLIERSYGTKIKMLDDREIRFNERPTIYNLFRIREPRTDLTLYHVFYLSDYRSHVGFCWVSFAIKNPTQDIEKQIIGGKGVMMSSANDFCHSLKIVP